MPDYKDSISEFMKQFEEENPETVSENTEPVQETTIPEITDFPQNQDTQVPTVQSDYATNNPQFNPAEFILNAFDGKSSCIGKTVIISNPPNLPVYARIGHDVNCVPYLFIPTQYQPIGKIEYDGHEYSVYQGIYKVGTLSYNSLSDSTWYFVPLGINVPQQIQNNQYSTQNNQNFKYTFNNVPPENAEQIISNIMECKPQNPVEINFAPSATESDKSKDIIDAPYE